MIEIELDDKPILDALNKLIRHGTDITPALKEIGEDLVESTKQRFVDSTGPDGESWPENAAVTIDRKGYNKPLIGETHLLSDTIDYQIDGDTLEIGSALEYAAMQQFGGTKAEFPWLWGDIQPRPYLGLSNDDRDTVLDVLSDYLAEI